MSSLLTKDEKNLIRKFAKDWLELVEPSPSTNLSDGKDWEIVAYIENDAAKTIWTIDKVVSDTWRSKFQDADYWCNTAPTLTGTKFTIHSVRRLSDNVVFSVGDVVNCDKCPSSFSQQKIEKFQIADKGFMIANCAGVATSINNISKLPTNPIPDTPVRSSWLKEQEDKRMKEFTDGFPNSIGIDEAAINEDTVVGSQCVCRVQVGMKVRHKEDGIWDRIGTVAQVMDIDWVKDNVLTSDKQNHSIGGFLEKIDSGRYEVIYYPTPLPEKTDTVVEDKTPFPHKGYLTITQEKLDLLVEKLVNEKVDAIREKAFNDARLNHPLAGLKFDTFNDYLNTLNPDNKAYTKEDIERWGNSTGNRWADKKDIESQPQPRTEKSDTGKDSKEWEIVSFIKDGELLPIDKDGWKYRNELNAISDIDWLIKNCTIHSVKRLSDNTVFTIGDKVYETITGNVENWIISEFSLKDTRCFSCGININNFEKVPKVPSTVTTDNSDVACLSLRDIRELWHKHYFGNQLLAEFEEHLQDFVTKKLKTHTP